MKTEIKKMAGGKGTGPYRRGNVLTNITDVEVGQLLIVDSKTYRATNLAKVTQTFSDKFYALFANPESPAEKRQGSDEEFVVYSHDLDKGEYYIALEPAPGAAIPEGDKTPEGAEKAKAEVKPEEGQKAKVNMPSKDEAVADAEGAPAAKPEPKGRDEAKEASKRASVGFGYAHPIETIEDLDGDLEMVAKEGVQKNVSFIMADGGRMCYDAVKQEYDLVKSNTQEYIESKGKNVAQSDWAVIGMDLNEEEQDLVCDHMGTKIEPLYGSKKVAVHPAGEAVQEASAKSKYALELATVLFISGFADEIERAEDEESMSADLKGVGEKLGYNESGKDLTEYVPEIMAEHGLEMPTAELMEAGQDLVNSINADWEGKLTVDELLDKFPHVAIDLALGSQGHGVSPEDDPEVAVFMEDKGVSSHSLWQEAVGDSIRDEAYSVLSEFMGRKEASKTKKALMLPILTQQELQKEQEQKEREKKEKAKKEAVKGKVAILYSINKLVTAFNEESQDWSGEMQDMGDIDKGHVWDIDEVVEILSKLSGIDPKDFQVYENRIGGSVVENGEGVADPKGKYLADYSAWIELGDGTEVTEEKLNEMLKGKIGEGHVTEVSPKEASKKVAADDNIKALDELSAKIRDFTAKTPVADMSDEQFEELKKMQEERKALMGNIYDVYDVKGLSPKASKKTAEGLQSFVDDEMVQLNSDYLRGNEEAGDYVLSQMTSLYGWTKNKMSLLDAYSKKNLRPELMQVVSELIDRYNQEFMAEHPVTPKTPEEEAEHERFLNSAKKAGYSTHVENKDKFKDAYAQHPVHTVTDAKHINKKPAFDSLLNDVDVADNEGKTLTFHTKDGKFIQMDLEGKYAAKTVKAFGEEPASAMERPDNNPITKDDPDVSSYGRYSEVSPEATPEKEAQAIAVITLKNGKTEKVPFDLESTDIDSDVEYYLKKEGIDWKSWKWEDMNEVFTRPDEYEFDTVQGESNEDFYEDGPSDEDIVIDEDGRSAFYAGKEIASISIEEYNASEGGIDALAAPIKEWMDKHQYWPNIWQQQERGDVTQLVIKKKGSVDALEETDAREAPEQMSMGSHGTFMSELLAGIETIREAGNSGEVDDDGSVGNQPMPSNFTGVNETEKFDRTEAALVVDELLAAKAISAVDFDGFMEVMADVYQISKEASKDFSEPFFNDDAKTLVAAIKTNLK